MEGHMVHDVYGGPHVHMCMKGHMYEGSHVWRVTWTYCDIHGCNCANYMNGLFNVH